MRLPMLLTLLAVLATTAAGCTHRAAEARASQCGLAPRIATIALSPSRAAASSHLTAGAPVPNDLVISAPLSAADDPPVLTVSAENGGPFETGVKPGRYPVREVDRDPLDCSLCMTIVGPISPATGQPSYTYAAKSGTVILQDLNPSPPAMVRGVLKDVVFEEVRFDRTKRSYASANPACQTTIARMRFDLPLSTLTDP